MAQRIEEILTQSALRARARHMVALDGMNWEAVRSAEGEGRASKLLEETITAEEEKIASRPGVVVFEDNSLPGYGVTYDNLSCFRGKGEGRFDMNYNLLRQIFYGLNYVEILEENSGVPHEILAAMNTFEILSLYRAFARLIEYGDIPTGTGKETISREKLKQMNAEDVVSKMVGYGCRHQAMGTMRQRGWTYFPTRRGDLIRRIRAFGPVIKDKFMRLLDNQKRITEFDVRAGEYFDFNDPCYDGRNREGRSRRIKGQSGRQLYTRKIASFMQGVYNRNTQQKA